MTQFLEYLKMAVANIKSNKGRSLLTMLGIIIGISSVIMIISIGNGVKGGINDELNSFAGGQLYVSLDSAKQKENMLEFTQDDFDAIQSKIPHVKAVTPEYYMYGGTVSAAKGKDCDAIVASGTEGYQYVISDPIIKGSYFTRENVENADNCCILAESGAKKLFGTTENVIGMPIEVTLYGTTVELYVMGIRKDSTSSMLNAMSGESTRIKIEMPYTVLNSSFGFYISGFDGAYIVGEGAEYSKDIYKATLNLLEARYNVRGEGLFVLQDFNDQLSMINNVLNLITMFVIFVASISLLVGGIGVMNIMLVSVTERTREIGIRKALGARTESILTQFLSESAIITLIGGIIGILLGILGAVGVCAIIGYPARITVGTVLLASLFSSCVGLFFGIYPAKKAAKLNPIEALRHE